MAFEVGQTWLGIGEKTGGTLFVVGMEGTEGMVFNVGNTAVRNNFSLMNARLGIGLGGGIGMVALCVFNCDSIWRINNTSANDWGVNISLGGQWSKIAKALKNYKFFTTVARVGAKLRRFVPEDAESIRNSLHYLYSEYDVASAGNAPKVVSIDIPIGVGLEASINYAFGGRIEIS